jgi:acetyl esterase/lipase
MTLDFNTNSKEYYSSERIKMRIVCREDWKGVDWKTGEVKGPPTHFKAVILHAHGGGFMFGSSGNSRPILYKQAISKGYPIFSVDYRVAP